MEKRARLKREKTNEPNLYRVGDAYYYRKGDFEKSLGSFRTEKDAVEHKRIFEAKQSAIGSLAFKFRVKDLWDDYVAERDPASQTRALTRKKISATSFEEMNGIYARHIRPFFGNKKLAEIDGPLWNKYVNQSKVSDLTNHRKVLTTFLTWTQEKGYLRVVPSFKVPEVQRRIRPILKPHEISLILENSQGPLLLYVSLYLFMGVRDGESIKLRWESIDIQRGYMMVKAETSRTRKGRAIPVNAFTLALLKQTKDLQKAFGIETPWVFPKAGKPSEHRYRSTMYLSWARMLKRTGLTGITPHDLRATYEYFANKRADFTDTQREKMAGAAIEVQRQRYVTFDAEDVRGLEEVVVFPGLENVIATKLNVPMPPPRGVVKSETGEGDGSLGTTTG